MNRNAFIRGVKLKQGTRRDVFPHTLPAFANFHGLGLHPRVTFFCGENGSGKSTLLEAIAVASGLGLQGGSSNFANPDDIRQCPLAKDLTVVRGTRRPAVLVNLHHLSER